MGVDQDRPAGGAMSTYEGTAADSGERYASMFTHHPHAAYSVGRTGYYTDGNARALAMTGLTLDQMRKSHFSQVIHPDDTHLIQASFDRALEGVPQLTEARVLRPDGTVVDIRCTMIPVVVDDEVVGIHGITEDVTEAKQMVHRLEAANAAKTLFLANVSHEVRTPLATVIGATELALDTDLDREAQRFVTMAHRAGQRLMRLVTDVLDHSRLEAEHVVARPRPFDVRSVIDDVAEWAVPLAESRGLTVLVDVGPDVPTTAVGDAPKISQVVTNLVHNAIKFTHEGRVEVAVRSRAGALVPGGDTGSPSSWLDITVTDTGIGIPEGNEHEIFEPFTQGDPSATRQHEGIGLGLAICRNLTRVMEGELDLRSTPAGGTTVAFRVPVGTVGEVPAPGSSRYELGGPEPRTGSSAR